MFMTPFMAVQILFHLCSLRIPPQQVCRGTSGVCESDLSILYWAKVQLAQIYFSLVTLSKETTVFWETGMTRIQENHIYFLVSWCLISTHWDENQFLLIYILTCLLMNEKRERRECGMICFVWHDMSCMD